MRDLIQTNSLHLFNISVKQGIQETLKNVNTLEEYEELLNDSNRERTSIRIKNAIDTVNETERINIEETLGRILGEDLLSCVNQPPFARSPLDGYAICADDTVGVTKETPMQLKVIDCVYAGGVSRKNCAKGRGSKDYDRSSDSADRADTIIRQEDTYTFQEKGDEFIGIYKEQKAFENYCFSGEDFQEGDCILKKGEHIDTS